MFDARSLLEIFKLRKGLKLSSYSIEVDTLDIPKRDAYETLGSSSITFPPLEDEYGHASLAQSPFSVSGQPEIAPSPYGTSSQISDPPIDQPISAHIYRNQPYYGPTQPENPLYSLRPSSAPSPKRFGPEYALWCVARPTVPEPMLQRAMDYACGTGVDCNPIRPNGPCFVPNTLVAHASYAFNSYWQRTKILGGTCDFGGTAMIITVDPTVVTLFIIDQHMVEDNPIKNMQMQ
ncbi:hypothetical protein Cgig2_009472 [Carnegiea gigantea]|uniref:X8 domain-containing protein n=1 Tax=Carnegiea gigantea TaxID=171969 RepID=A0A9Q1QD45_9CARY|nr:hypothetical protein Cgig2_009472 [Carnegiea gigantea]